MTSAESDVPNNSYLQELSRGGLLIPSASLSTAVAATLAQLDYIQKFVPSTHVGNLCYHALDKYAPLVLVSCEAHHDSNRKKMIKMVINMFYNKMQRLAGDQVRKQQVNAFKKRQRNKE